MFITNLRYESLYFYPTAAKQMERYDFSGLCMYVSLIILETTWQMKRLDVPRGRL